MKIQITLQDLKDNKSAILDYCSFYTHVPAKELMQYMLDLVNNDMAEIREDETFEDFISETYNFLKPRSRKAPKYIETLGNLKANGHIEDISLNERYARKNGY